MRSVRARSTRLALAVVMIVPLALALPVSSSAAPSRSELREAEDRLMELERDFQLVSERYNLVNERLAGLQARIGELGLEVKSIQQRMNTNRAAAVALAQQMYKSGGMQPLEAVLSSSSIAEISTRLTYLESSEAHRTRVFERLLADRKTLDARIAELEVAQEDAAAARTRLAALRAEVEEKVAEQSDEIAALTARIETAERREAERLAAERAEAAATAMAAQDVGVTAAQVGAAPAPNPRAQAAVDAALTQVGKPYRWGAAGPDSYDCSGLTMWAWAHAGVSLPHNSQMQFDATPRVAQSDWAPGDLLFFGSPIHHVGMYIGNGQMVEAPYTGSQVRVNSAYRSDYVGAGRP